MPNYDGTGPRKIFGCRKYVNFKNDSENIQEGIGRGRGRRRGNCY